ncbi:snRNA-activating protein complex subunit 2 [Tiliqua scincoides]|uniref:snRNA-activating protein complex subunit 2 n=1 Tax=Tiliqua scincoides TaxID=71010 RepID=UPI0034623098
MKPPSRRRSAPARYGLGGAARVWTAKEKRRLLTALRAQGQGPLQPQLLKKYLPSRDEAEILAFVDLLKLRVAREAVQDQYQYRQRKQKDAPIPAPIEVWTELAEKLTGGLEDAVTTAFSQVLTVASAEPLSLFYSIPPKPVDAKNTQSSPSLHSENRKPSEESQAATISSNTEKLGPEQNEFHIDFERIYMYLSVISRGSKAPELPPSESAVLLDLLLSLPEELGFLDFKKLKSHMHKSYMDLSARYKSERSKTQAESSLPVRNSSELQDTTLSPHAATSTLPQQEDTSCTTPTVASKSDNTQTSAVNWKVLGVCPLNSFSFPLDMLSQKKQSLD